MSEGKGFAIPWGSLVAIAAFIGSTMLVPQAFDVLRPAERERPKPGASAELEIDARLWEDPFSAMRRSDAERQSACSGQQAVPGCRPEDLQRRRDPATLRELIERAVERAQVHGGGRNPKPLLLAVTVPGAPFVGAEEARRRTRYAVLSGLQAGGWMPYNAERMGQLAFATSAGPSVQVPFETLLPTGDPARAPPDVLAGQLGAPRRERVIVLWIDETALPGRKMDSLAEVLGALAPDGPEHGPDVALIGPSTSDGLQLALRELHDVAAACDLPATTRPCRGMSDAAWAGYRLLAAGRLLNASATAPRLYLDGVDGGSLRDTLSTLLNRIDGQRSGRVEWRRTVATDDRMVQAMVDELARRLPAEVPRRVLLLAERDSLYAQAMVEQFTERLGRKAHNLEPTVSYFFRGLDGITARDASDRAAGGAPAPKSARTATAIEWPESRDQLDYLRRLAQSVRDAEALDGRRIGAIGIIANDVHDKLLVLQAMHEQFVDRLFFTVDMDARFAHPRALPFTRNLIVVSGLPLELPPRLTTQTAPLRDMYQMATFLAAQRALCVDAACAFVDELLRSMHQSPSVYEVGRTRAVPVDGYDREWRDSGAEPVRARLAAMLLAALAFLLLAWPSTPAMREMGALLVGRPQPRASDERPQWPLVLTVAAYLMVLAYAAALAVEFVHPGQWAVRSVAVALIAAGAIALAVMTAGLWARRAELAERRPAWASRLRRGAVGVGVAVLALAVGTLAVRLVLSVAEQTAPPSPDAEPVALAEGISAWPSQAVFVLAMLTVVYALDRIWQAALHSMAEDHDWLGMGTPAPRPARWGWDRLPRRIVRRARCTSLMWWPHRTEGPVNMARLWRQYLLRGRPPARVGRTLMALALTLALAGGVFLLLGGESALGVPVRGAAQRTLAAASFVAVALAMLPLLMVAVADSTTLAVRFIGLMGRGRSRYPAAVVARFAAAQGPQLAALWRTPVAALPADRAEGDATVSPAHSLLDDWIDLQLVARRTEVVSPLIVWPLVAVALLLFARSRLFDNWAFTLPVALVGAAYLAWTVSLSVALKVVCERLREQALRRMNADLHWLAGAGPELGKLVEPMKRLIAAVTDERRGAFAGLLEQPLFKGLMVPLGGAGGAQIFDYLLLAR